MITKGVFRITFEVNNLEPFTWTGFDGIATFERAVVLADILARFDLGKNVSNEIEANHASVMIKSYQAFRRKHGINHPDLVFMSSMTIDQFDGIDWWIVSDDCEELTNQMGWSEAFDTTDGAWERYESLIHEMLTETTVG